MNDQKLKPMSAADYRANAERVKADRPTEIVRLQSGSVFELRRPDLQSYMVMGRLPKSLVDVGIKAWKAQSTQSAEKSLTDEDAIDALVFMREIVHDCTVRPKFVEFATNDDEIGAAEMLREDFDEIFHWAMNYQGVAGIESLQTFRDGPARGVAGNRTDRKRRRRQAKPSPEIAGAIR